ncbi:D-lactate dehydrogenase [bacterium A37T11]|nr:D-lactate dehydrogenase [bacterium A37T11]
MNNIKELLEGFLPEERVKTSLIDLVAFAADAGFYHLKPKAVVLPASEKEVQALFEFSRKNHIPLTFRAGGTSLSGQSITDGILVVLNRFWDGIFIESEGAYVRVQPGITGAMVNTYLKKYKRKIGPDPASINAAMMGGILSNNSSGMCCGVKLNSYHTTRFVRFMLPSGQVFSTEKPADYTRFEQECPELYQVLKQQRNRIHQQPELSQRIRSKYLTKNTVGYSLNAFIDHEHPLDIMAHLLIGAEGTLGFIAEAVLTTVPDLPFKSTAMVYFPDIYAACQAIVPLTDSGAEAVELMDRASLRSVENMKGIPAIIRTLSETAAALLIEYQGEHQETLHEKTGKFLAISGGLSMLNEPVFTTDPAEQAFLWKVRKGMFPAVGAVRASGTTVILEDVAFPVAKLGDAILDLHQLFKQYGYDEAIIFGHAKDGNIHFVVTQAFDSPTEIARYDTFLKEVVNLVVNKYDGALKAEHGTGRNMAPFIETEWGGEAYAIMKAIKQAADPEGLLNPGVIINAHADAHIRDLKPLPSVESEVDKCIECGYCEHKCPSRDITLTPRQRIVVRRELRNLDKRGEKREFKLLLDQYQYSGLDTCAVDGLCASACPVDINTGSLVKRLRRESHSRWANWLAMQVAKNFKAIGAGARFALASGVTLNKIFGPTSMRRLTAGIRKVLPAFPLWANELRPAPSIQTDRHVNLVDSGVEEKAIYFPSCINSMMGAIKPGQKDIRNTLREVALKAGVRLFIPQELHGTCCGQLFSSKGFGEAYNYTANHTIERLWKLTEEGVLPVVIDVTSCTHSLQESRTFLTQENQGKFDRLRILDSIDFLHDVLMPRMQALRKKESVVLHPVCTLTKMGLQPKLLRIAQHFSEKVTIPVTAGCCGMAGDRGFLFPELTRSATHHEATEVDQHAYEGHYSTGKTCEIAMAEATGQNYESIVYLVDYCTSTE